MAAFSIEDQKLGTCTSAGHWSRLVTAAGAAVLLSFLAALSVVQAGQISLAWDPVADPALQWYRLCYGRESRHVQKYPDCDDLPSTAVGHELTGLADCIPWYISIASVNTEGLAGSWSPEIVGFTQPTVSGAVPDVLLAGATQQVTLEGVSFEPEVEIEASEPLVSQKERLSCNRIVVTVQVPVELTTGTVALTPVNSRSVPAAASAVLSIVTDPGPRVTSARPADGSNEVAPDLPLILVFDRDVLAASVTPATVQLLDAAGQAVPQAPGSPAVSGSTVTVTPAAPLAQTARYRLQVMPGTTGVLDAQGQPMVFGYQQVAGFQIADLAPSDVPGLRRTDTQPPS